MMVAKLLLLIFLPSVLSFQLSSVPTANRRRIHGYPVASHGRRQAGFLQMATERGEGVEGSDLQQSDSRWRRFTEKVSKNKDVLFGVGAAIVAGFNTPQAVENAKAVKEGHKDMSSVVKGMVRPPSAEAFSLKPFSRRTLKEKLASVPCFLVCNQQGSPYLVPLETGFDVGVVFLDPADAEEMMQSMVQNPQTADARILVMGLDKGLELVQSEPRRNGNHMLVFQFCPSVQQLKNANGFRKVGWKAILDKKPDKWRFGFNRQGVRNAGIPVFYCPDLRIAKGREMVKPIFFSLEDLYYAWDRSTAGKHGAAPGDVKTLDFLRVIEWMINEPDQTRLVGLHASTQAQDYVETTLKDKGGRTRPIRPS